MSRLLWISRFPMTPRPGLEDVLRRFVLNCKLLLLLSPISQRPALRAWTIWTKRGPLSLGKSMG